MNDNIRLVKNTIFLYLRLAITIFIKLYIARILLDCIGIDKYGIWNLIASFVVAFQLVSAPIVISTQRFLNYEMGKGGEKLNTIFNLCLEFIIIASILTLIGLESIGSWFIESKLNFPSSDRNIINILYQITILGLIIQMLQKPFEATVIAHERMSFFALMSFIEAIYLLIITLVLKSDLISDKLITYGYLNLSSYLIIFTCYIVYCLRTFNCCKIKLVWDKKLSLEIISFSGWNLFSGLSSMTANQGVNILINIFFGVALNAAYGIANQIKSPITMLILNLQKAFDPQIVKNYSTHNLSRLHFLTLSVIQLSYILSLVIIIPIIINMDNILYYWLGNEIPPFTNIFCTLTLVQMLFLALGGPIDTAILATGKIRSYQLWLSSEIFLNIIFTYILFKKSYGPEWAFIVKIMVEVILLLTRFIYLKQIDMTISIILKKVLVPLITITLLSYSITYFCIILTHIHSKIVSIIFTSMIYISTTLVISWIMLLNKNQRSRIISKLKHSIIEIK